MKLDKNKVFSFIRNRISVGKLFLAIFIIFIDTTEYYNRRIEELKTDKNIIEQVAREQYLMSKPNEDIYLIENKK